MIANQTNSRPLMRSIAMVVTAALLMSGSAVAKDKDTKKDSDQIPQVTTDGLKLTKQTKQRVVYVADDVDFSQYTKVMIVECAVAFAKNWQRDYNRNERDLTRQVRDKDVTRMKDKLASEFKDVFTKTMTDNGVEVVTEAAADVIILRPAIVNVQVTAPNLQNSPGMSRQFVSDAGQMTLYLELYDSVSSTILAKAMDARDASRSSPGMSYSTGVSNIAAADRMLKNWANEIAAHFGAVTEPNADANDSGDSDDDS